MPIFADQRSPAQPVSEPGLPSDPALAAPSPAVLERALSHLLAPSSRGRRGTEPARSTPPTPAPASARPANLSGSQICQAAAAELAPGSCPAPRPLPPTGEEDGGGVQQRLPASRMDHVTVSGGDRREPGSPQPSADSLSATQRPARRFAPTRPPHVGAGRLRRTRRSVLDTVEVPRSASLDFDRVVGKLAQRLLADNMDAARGLAASDLVNLFFAQAHVLVAREGVPSRREAAATRITSLASHYVQRLAPPEFVTYLGAEQALGEGRIDLTFEHPTLGVFFDELKAWRNPRLVLDEATEAQLERFVRGAANYRTRCAGIRLLPVSALTDARLHRSDGTAVPLAATPLSPVALRRQQDALVRAGGDLSVLPGIGAAA